MKIYSEDKLRFIEIGTTSAELVAYPSISFSVEISSPEISGRHPEIWFTLEAAELFLNELAELESKREGSVTLKSMSADVCELTFRGLDRRGHLAFKVRIASDIYNGGRPFKYGLFIEFEIEPTALPAIIGDFQEMIAEQKRLSQ